MSSPADLTPGTVGFGPIAGGAGALVSAGQLLLGEGFHVGKLDVRHVFMVTDVVPGARYDTQRARCVEAMPSGARAAWIGDRWTPKYAYVQLPEDYPGQAEDAAAIARAMIGTPYSFASYAALAAWRFGVKTPQLEKWIDRRKLTIDIATRRPVLAVRGEPIEVSLPREAICSVLADQAWALTGKQVMPKGTPHQCVTPGALAQALLEMEGAKWLWPGMTGR